MAERPQRDIYVPFDGKFYKLLFSLYGLDDAPRLLNDGLVQHLKSGGYLQKSMGYLPVYQMDICHVVCFHCILFG